MEELAVKAHLSVVGHGAIATRNVTSAEKSLVFYAKQQLRRLEHGGGFSRDKWPSVVGQLFRVSFTEVVLVAGEVPSCRMHSVSALLLTGQSFPTLIDHTTSDCGGYPPHLQYAYGGTDIPQIDLSSLHEPPNTLKVVSYNIWNFEKPYHKRMDMIAHQLSELNPHIIGLQEVRLSDHEYPDKTHQGATITDLARRLYSHGYEHWVWRPAMLYTSVTGNQTFEGLAFFSQYPITDFEARPLTRDDKGRDDYHQRIALRVEVKTAIGTVNVFNTHFSLEQSSRDINCVELRDWMHYYALHGPTLLMGDLNAERSASKGIQYLLGETQIAVSTGFLKDSFDWVLRNAPSSAEADESDDLESIWTFTTLHAKPKKRIDFVLYTPNHLEVALATVLENKFADTKIQPSDHRAVVVEFRKP